MRLTDHTDYSLRVLMYLNENRTLTTLDELSKKLEISRNNLIKVSNQLSKAGWVESTRGRSGGIVISDTAGEKTLREIISSTEESFNIAQCFSKKESNCTFIRMCPLKQKLNEALEAFLASLGRVTLNDVTPSPTTYRG